jgi:glucosyl-dolichyl phosphate glucuronosyltransferase
LKHISTKSAAARPLNTNGIASSRRVLDTAQLVVILATHNGGKWIERVLAGYQRQQGAEFPWALMVIDNASTDETPAILERFRAVLPLVVVTEPRPGKNAALNRGLAAIDNDHCDYVFTDDDAVPDSGFLAAWHKVFAQRRDYGLFGGTVLPCFEGVDETVPQRFAKWHPEIYACNLRSEGAIPPGAIFGPNMGVAGEILRAGYRFNEDIGPKSSDAMYAMGSETEFCVRVAREAKVSCWFTPEPRASHIVRPNQATEDFILARAYRHGRGCAVKDGPVHSSFGGLIKEQLLIARFEITGLLGSAEARWNAAWHRGFVAGLRDEFRPGTATRA